MTEFAAQLLAWFDRFGRHDLPWQSQPTPYSVWVSEIMLQQTQVTTVIPYYERFMQRFPDVVSLAEADVDEVLAHWSGLGYYARARNLHRAAGIVSSEHAGRLPENFDVLTALPGIGRSTAGAILSIACGQRHPILDGNVKRVLTRRHGIAEWPSKTAVARELWALADALTPPVRVADYTQAIMDLGATLCTRRNPRCGECPVAADCVARRDGLQHALPAPRPKRTKPRRSVSMLVIRDSGGAVLLERRPPAGIWGGLYSFPELGEAASPADWGREHLGIALDAARPMASLSHSFTHFDLDIAPLLVAVDRQGSAVMDREGLVWYKPDAPQPLGLPAPVARVLERLPEDIEGAS